MRYDIFAVIGAS